MHFVLYPTYIRGKSYLSAKQGAAAAIEFQKILDHPGLVGNEPIAALAHLELGRAYALSGEKARANTAYQEFFPLEGRGKQRPNSPACNERRRGRGNIPKSPHPPENCRLLCDRHRAAGFHCDVPAVVRAAPTLADIDKYCVVVKRAAC